MSVIAQALSTVTLGERRSFARLSVTPLLNPNVQTPVYLLLDQAVQQGLVTIGEISNAGSVPDLKFENRATKPVLIVDGEALVGAKQNRIANITILVPPLSVLTIPVSCVERGRWQYRRHDFAPSDHVLFSSSRASKARDVTAALKVSGTARADQAAIWHGIASKAARMAAPSRSEAMEEIYARRRRSLSEFESAMAPVEGECGAVFTLEGQIVGMELFDSPITWRRFSAKVLRSYAIDALDEGACAAGSGGTVNDWLHRVRTAATTQFPALGLGTDVRVEDGRLAGGALADSGSLVHCAIFEAIDSRQHHQRF